MRIKAARKFPRREKYNFYRADGDAEEEAEAGTEATETPGASSRSLAKAPATGSRSLSGIRATTM